jgi:hypothetical protein
MRPRVGEARGDTRELEGRLEEALAERLTRQIVVGEVRDAAIEPDARERLAAARILGDEDPAVVDEGVARVALLDQQSETVAGARVGGEVEVRGEDVDHGEHQPRRLARPLDRVEERTLDDTAHRLDPKLGDGLGPADPPATVRRAGGEGKPRARLVSDLGRLVPGIPDDLDRGARPDPSEVGAVLPELRGEQGGAARLHTAARERLRERVAAAHLNAPNRYGICGNDELFGFGSGQPARRRRVPGPDI